MNDTTNITGLDWLRKREQELTTALVDLQARLHEVRAMIIAVERATGQRPATGRPRKPVQVIGLHPHGSDADPDPGDAA
jgi:hypothetical protein